MYENGNALKHDTRLRAVASARILRACSLPLHLVGYTCRLHTTTLHLKLR